MSNKIQIDCNLHNKTQLRLIKFCEERIKLDRIELLSSQKEESELIVQIRKNNSAIQLVKLGKVQKRIDYIKKRIQLMKEWIKESLDTLIIC